MRGKLWGLVVAIGLLTLTRPTAADPISDFAQDTFPAIMSAKAGTPGNIIIGPNDLYRLATMLAAGSGGDTNRALAQALHSGATLDTALSVAGPSLAADGLIQAAGVWVATGVALQDAYRQTLIERLGADARSEDLSRPDAIARINDWAAEHSRGKITNLLPRGGTNAALIAASATYVKQRWAVPFSAQATRPQPFTLADGRKVEVATMEHPALSARYAEQAGAQAVILPFEGGKFDLTLILPAAGAAPSAAVLASLLDRTQYQERTGHLALPRLYVKSRLDLADIHGVAWIRILTDQPDLAGIAKGVSKVDNLFHSVFLSLDETGAEAASASAAIVSRSLRPSGFTLLLNRPFFIVLRHVATDRPVLMGLIADPVVEGGQ